MQLSIGELIRQLRRQRSMTQTELGGAQFSKSYISAVERNKIVPSHEALHFFAQQLEQPYELFSALLQTQNQSLSSAAENSLPIRQELQPLLHHLLELAVQASAAHVCAPPVFDPLWQETLPIEEQSYFAFLVGSSAQARHDLSAALTALEHALALIPACYQPAVLDEIGLNYYFSHSYQTALHYHKRARQLLLDENISDIGTDKPDMASFLSQLRVHVNMHCGDDYRALGDYEKARICYEQARQQVTPCQNLHLAAQLYSGLGYCIYASAYQQTVIPLTPTTPESTHALEQALQQALTCLGQSRMLYQLGNNREGEMHASLLQCMTLIDFSHLLKQRLQDKLEDEIEQGTTTEETPSTIQIMAMLDEAREQCLQVLHHWQELHSQDELPAPSALTTLYTALAYLIRVCIQYAAAARLGGHAEVAGRERTIATHLCQLALDTLKQASLSREQLRNLTLIIVQRSFNESSGSQFPHLSESTSALAHPHTMGQAETCFAIGEVAEELGGVATSLDEARKHYHNADQYFQIALAMARASTNEQEHAGGTLMRLYQRNINVLEERLHAHPQLTAEITRTLLHLLKDDLVLS
jgi:tetratricopeptide (TPR) repeat protein